MSDEQEEVASGSGEQNQDDEEEEAEVSNEDEDEQGEGDQDESGEQDSEEQGEQQSGEGDENEDEQQSKQQTPPPPPPQVRHNLNQEYRLPDFPRRQNENSIDSILNELGSLQNSVDHLIDTFPSHKGTRYSGSFLPVRSNLRSAPMEPLVENRSRLEEMVSQVGSMQIKPPVVFLKDEDTQVDMQPQIIIKAIPVHERQQKERLFEGNRNYKINTESDNFLTKYQQESKKYRRWDRTQPELRNRQRFQRRDCQQGVFNIQQRNKEIDQAMRLLRQ